MNKVRICLIGGGRVARVHGTNLKDQIPSSEVVAVVDAREDVAEALASDLKVSSVFTDYREALRWDRFDAAVVTTPTFTHQEITTALARADKHIFCEKPMAVDLAEADSMIDACEESGVKLQIGFMRRFDPEFRQAKEKVRKGEIGQLLLVKSTGRGPGLPPEWALDVKKSGGMLAEVASHDFDSLMWFADSRLETVEAIAANYRCPQLTESYPHFYDTSVVMGTFGNGKMGIVDMSCPVHYGYDARVELLGSEGVMFIGGIQGRDLTVCTRNKGVREPQYLSWRDRFKEGYIAEMQHFIHCIIENSPPFVGGEEGRESLAAVIASNRSIRIGEKVKVNY